MREMGSRGVGAGGGGIRGCGVCASAIFPGEDCSKALLHPSQHLPPGTSGLPQGKCAPLHAMTAGLSQCWRAACELPTWKPHFPHDYQSNTPLQKRRKVQKVLRSMRTKSAIILSPKELFALNAFSSKFFTNTSAQIL